MSEYIPRVLVTGGGGYVGSVLVPLLLRRYHVRVLDRFTNPHPSLLAVSSHPNFEAVRGDCRDRNVLGECLKGMDFIIPLAAVVGAPACEKNQVEAETTNLGAILTLASLIAHTDKKVLYPNTNSAYGKTPIGEETDESSPLHPLSLYAQTKQWAEKALLEGLEENAVSFRFATAFGPSPRMRIDLLVNDFVYQAVKGRSVALYEPEFRRNFIHVRDMARVFIYAIERFSTFAGKVFNVGLWKGVTKRELAEIVKAQIPDFHFWEMDGAKDPDQRDYNVSVKRITETGFLCDIGLEEGILELITAYKMFPTEAFRNA